MEDFKTDLELMVHIGTKLVREVEKIETKIKKTESDNKESLISAVIYESLKHYSTIPKMEKYMKNISMIYEEKPVDVTQFCFHIRNLLEVVVGTVYEKHHGSLVPGIRIDTALEGIRKMLKFPSLVNGLYQLRECVSPFIHDLPNTGEYEFDANYILCVLCIVMHDIPKLLDEKYFTKKVKDIDKRNNRRYKTKLCLHWSTNGKCRDGDNCIFAHGEDELRKS